MNNPLYTLALPEGFTVPEGEIHCAIFRYEYSPGFFVEHTATLRPVPPVPTEPGLRETLENLRTLWKRWPNVSANEMQMACKAADKALASAGEVEAIEGDCSQAVIKLQKELLQAAIAEIERLRSQPPPRDGWVARVELQEAWLEAERKSFSIFYEAHLAMLARRPDCTMLMSEQLFEAWRTRAAQALPPPPATGEAVADHTITLGGYTLKRKVTAVEARDIASFHTKHWPEEKVVIEKQPGEQFREALAEPPKPEIPECSGCGGRGSFCDGEDCKVCGGTGIIIPSPPVERCPACGGRGSILHVNCIDEKPCPKGCKPKQPTPATDEEMRKAFEEWVSHPDRGWNLARMDITEGPYRFDRVYDSWNIWKACTRWMEGRAKSK